MIGVVHAFDLKKNHNCMKLVEILDPFLRSLDVYRRKIPTLTMRYIALNLVVFYFQPSLS